MTVKSSLEKSLILNWGALTEDEFLEYWGKCIEMFDTLDANGGKMT